MRTAVLVLVVFIGGPGGALADDARSVVARAIQAQGGEARLARARHMVRNARGVMTFFGKEIPFTTRLMLDFPDRFWETIEVGNPATQKLTRVLTPEKGWRAGSGATADMPRDEAAELRDEVYVLWLMTLVPLEDPASRLSSLPDGTVDGRPAAGVQVLRDGRPAVKLFFDKGTGLLTRIERRAREAGLLVEKEYLLSQPREFEGITLPTRTIEKINGKKTLELTVASYEFPEKFPASQFTRP